MNLFQRNKASKASESGAALILILGIVALLTVMVVAFLGMSSKQINDAKSSSTAVEKNHLTEFAASQFLTDVKNEINAGSVSPVEAGSFALYPATPLSAVPDRYSASRANGSNTAPSAPAASPANLIKQSAYQREFYDVNLGMERLQDAEVQMAFPKSADFPPSARASNIRSDSGSANFVSAARWNRPLLLPRKNPNVGDIFPEGYEPAAIDTSSTSSWAWQPPDWIYLAQDGTNPTKFDRAYIATGTNPVLGRYAFQAYDIGGLLDLNVAGYDPDAVPPTSAARKGSLGLADLSAIDLTKPQIKALLKYRNPATQATTASAGGPFGNNYLNFLLRSPDAASSGAVWPGNNGFMKTSSFGGVSNNAFASRKHLKSFLLGGMGTDTIPDSASAESAKLMDILQYVTHFTRSLEQPSYKPGFYLSDSTGARTRSNKTLAGSPPASTAVSPVYIRPSIVPPKDKVDDTLYPIDAVSSTTPYAPSYMSTYHQPYEMALGNNRGGNDAWGTLEERGYGGNPLGVPTSTITPPQVPRSSALQDVINPAFLEVRVQSRFTRLDNTLAMPGEPLVKKRFPLERLVWITYRGPSANLPPGDPLYNSLGTERNIYAAFGLKWQTSNNQLDPEAGYFWAYNHGKAGEIYTLAEVANLGREPDFIELLYAAIGVGSVGKSAVSDHNPGEPWDTAVYQQLRDRTSRFQVIEIAANLIDQYDADSYPTVIKLPNPRRNPDSSTASEYYPALFSARGVEDLPYFYRLQWRAVKNYNRSTVPSPDFEDPRRGGLPGVRELFQGDPNLNNFECGTTSLIAFPELWNPHVMHAQFLNGTSAGPSEFRVIAASQTPNDVLLPNSWITSSKDCGLMNNPKIYDPNDPTTATDPSRKIWMDNSAYVFKKFSARTMGNFKFCYPNEINLGNPDLWGWFMGSDYPSNLGRAFLRDGPTPFLNHSSPSLFAGTNPSIFWNPRPSLTNLAATDPFYGSKSGSPSEAGAFLSSVIAYEYSFYKNQMGVNANPLMADFVVQLSSTGTISTAIVGGSLTIYENNFSDENTLKANISDGYPFAGVKQLDPARWYVMPDRANPNFPPNGKHFTDLNMIRVSLSNEFAASRLPTPTRSTINIQAGNPYTASPTPSIWIDYRGTELLFKNPANTSLFREPTPLCHSGFPAGSELRAGPNNFFSVAPYSGGVDDGNNNKWIGFSLGEAPSQFISAIRLEVGSYNVIDTGSYDASGYKILKLGGVPDTFRQITQYAGTYTYQKVPPPYTDTYSALPTSIPHQFRFFGVPVNIVGIEDDQLMTVQIQYKDSAGKWVTYDERYVKINGGKSSQTPVLYKSQYAPYPGAMGTGIAWGDPGAAPLNYKINGTQKLGYQMGWGNPLVTSYDPRSSRFGHPIRNANSSQTAVYGYQIQQSFLNPNSPNDAGLFGLSANTNNKTDRPDPSVIDGFTNASSVPPSQLIPSHGVPAAWNMIGGYTWALGMIAQNDGASWTYPMDYNLLYRALLNDNSAISALLSPPTGKSPPGGNSGSWPKWWAQGKLNRGFLWRPPSVNANDYGWFSRAPFPSAGSNLLRYCTTFNQLNKGTFSNNSISNFKRPGYWHDAAGGASPPFGWDEADSLRIGSFSENIQPKLPDGRDPLAMPGTNSEFRQAYADPDDVVRRAMGAYVAINGYQANSRDGLPLGQLGTGTNSDNRPIVLNRPFQSVADMGYAFRGSPWRNLSFSTPETADAALLDVFCLSEAPPLMRSKPADIPDSPAPPLVSGKINLNTRQDKVLTALLSGALKNEAGSESLGSEASTSAQKLIARTTSRKAWLGPLCNVSELAGKLFGKDLSSQNFSLQQDPVYTSIVYQTDTEPKRNPDMDTTRSPASLTWHYTGFSADLDSVFPAVKDKKNLRMRESVIRALADGGQTRVWNIMLDLIVQTGRLVPSPATTGLDKFTRESERRVWVYLAIDRLTGEVLDQQVEEVLD